MVQIRPRGTILLNQPVQFCFSVSAIISLWQIDPGDVKRIEARLRLWEVDKWGGEAEEEEHNRRGGEKCLKVILIRPQENRGAL